MCCLAWGGKVANSWKHPCFWAVNLGCRFLFYRGKQVMVGCLLMARLFPLDFFFLSGRISKKKGSQQLWFLFDSDFEDTPSVPERMEFLHFEVRFSEM